MTAFGGELICGGYFTTAGENISAFWARWGPGCARGDMNCDGVLGAADVQLFASAMIEPASQSDCKSFLANLVADVESDGRPRIDADDLQPFVLAMLQP